MKMLVIPACTVLCCLLLSGCGIWTHYIPVHADNTYEWFQDSSSLILQQDSSLTARAEIPELIRGTKMDSLMYSLSISSDQDGQVIVKDIFIEVWDYRSGELITPAYHEISTLKGDYLNKSVFDLPDSLRALRAGQHRIAYVAYIPKSIIDKKKNLEMHFYIKAIVSGREVIIDRRIKFYRINDPLLLLCV